MFYSIYWLHLDINSCKSWYDWLRRCNQKRNRSVTRIDAVTLFGYLLHFRWHLSKSQILSVITESISHFTVGTLNNGFFPILAPKRNHLSRWLRFGYTYGYVLSVAQLRFRDTNYVVVLSSLMTCLLNWLANLAILDWVLESSGL